MRSLTLKKLEQDKAKIEGLIRQTQQQLAQLNAQALRLGGALGYINDNIKELKEVRDDRKGTNRES